MNAISCHLTWPRMGRLCRPLVLALLGALLCAGCAAKRQTAHPAPLPKPERPQSGVTINPEGLARYVQIESARLFEAGKLDTNLSAQLSRKSCRLKLAPGSDRCLDSAALAAAVEDSVVVVGQLFKCNRCSQLHLSHGTGFFLTESGALATCLHLVAECRQGQMISLVAMTRNGQVLPVREVLATDRANDLAILKVEGNGFKPAPIGPAAPTGTPVFVLSHPDCWYYLASTGIVSGNFRSNQKPCLTITADFGRGSSGAPVFNYSGAVVGIAKATRSTYYEDNGIQQRNLQMVEKLCAPSAALLDLVQPE